MNAGRSRVIDRGGKEKVFYVQTDGKCVKRNDSIVVFCVVFNGLKVDFSLKYAEIYFIVWSTHLQNSDKMGD